MNYYVEQKVLDLGVKIIFVEIMGLDNNSVNEEWQSYRCEELKNLYEAYKDLDSKADPILEGFNLLHDKVGVKRKRYLSAPENLIKLLNKNEGDLFFINNVVDIYNLISIQTKLALGAHDIDRTTGNMTLRLTNGSEKYVPLGQSEPAEVKSNEYCYCDDDNEILCRLEIRQVNKTAVNNESKNVFYIVQGNENTPDELLETTAKKIIDYTVKYCSGTGRIIHPEII